MLIVLGVYWDLEILKYNFRVEFPAKVIVS